MRRLSQLLARSNARADDAPPGGYRVTGGDPVIVGLSPDSRRIEKGMLFAALPGSKQDGCSFIPQALRQGAAAILGGMDLTADAPEDIAIIRAAEPRWLLAKLAAAFYETAPPHIAAITGTNGKTSTAQFLREIWTHCGRHAASIGTLGVISSARQDYGGLTTPDTVTLHKILAELAAEGATHAALEASSHGLAQYRLDGLHIDAAGFTNFTRDHLDYHGTMEDYYAAKVRLFDALLPPGGAAVLNADAPECGDLAARASRRGGKILTYGENGKDFRILAINPHLNGQDIQVEILGKKHTIRLNIVGRFQVWNALCALGLAIGQGAAPDRAVAALAGLTGVHGRLQHVAASPKGAPIFVDYAHTPDALETVLRALRPHVDAGKQGRLAVVFGCGGNRDPGKRPMMGGIAQRLADIAIVTDDNPRFEEPAAIRAAILAGCQPQPAMHEIGDRRAAIKSAIAMLQPGDILVIAGKGHEPGQIIGDRVLPFDDGETARELAAGEA